MNIIVNVAVILFFGLFFGKLIKILKLPEVTGYLIAGLIIGPYILNMLSLDDIYILEPFNIIALTFISFIIGSELKWKYIKKLGIKPFVIGFATSICSLVLVTSGSLLLGYSFDFSLLLGAIASSSAPSSVLMIVKEYKAKGQFTNTMLSVIAISDILSVILFGICLVVVKDNNSLISLIEPLKEIMFSLIIGSLIGYIIGILAKHLKTHSEIIILLIIAIFVAIIICDIINISQLLSAMIMGITFINLFNHRVTDHVLETINDISGPLLLIFFVISGANLDFNILPSIGIIGIVYIFLRILGKFIGNLIGSKITKESQKITKYLGITLLSQTGVAVGLAAIAMPLLKDGQLLVTIVVASSFIFDIICPLLVKYILKKIKEI